MGVRAIVTLVDVILLPLIIALYGAGVGWVIDHFQKGILEIKLEFYKEIKRIILEGVSQSDYGRPLYADIYEISVNDIYKVNSTRANMFYTKWVNTLQYLKDVCKFYKNRFDFCKAISFYYSGEMVCVKSKGEMWWLLCAGGS